MIQKIRRIAGDSRVQNSVWSISDAFLYPMLMLIFSPFFIDRLGIEQFGVWAFINSLVAGLGVLNFGMADSLVRYISVYRGKDDLNSVSRIIGNGLAATGWLSVFLSFLVLIVWLVWISLADGNQSDRMPALWAWGGLTFSMKLVEQSLLSVPRGFESYSRSALLSMISKLLLFALNVSVIAVGLGLDVVFAAAAVLMAGILVIDWMVLTRWYPMLRLMFIPDRQTLREMLSFGTWSWIQSINGLLAGQADRLLVGFIAGTTQLGYYSIAAMIASQLHSVLAAGASWLFPAIGRQIESGKPVRHLYYQMQFLVSGAGMGAVLILFLAGGTLFEAWLGPPVFSQAGPLIQLYLLFTAFSVTTIVPFFFMNGSGFVRLNTGIGLSSSLINLASMWIGYVSIGALGLVAGRFVSPLTVSLAGRYILHRRVLQERTGLIGVVLLIPPVICLLFWWVTDWWMVMSVIGFLFTWYGLYFYWLKKIQQTS